jgi:hypothetical protein
MGGNARRENQMKQVAWFSMGIVLFCLGCSAGELENQHVEGRRFSGRLILLVADDFAKQSSTIHYELLSIEDGRTFSLQFSDQEDMTDIKSIKSGTWVEIFGRQRNGRIDVETLRIIAPLEKGTQEQ